MGLGPIMAIYQARYARYLEARGLSDTAGTHVWAFLGDGECDEPETLGCIGIAAREKLDNLIFVVNCNLQRLDGPVRGNGKIIQELEGTFRGAGWNVVKCIWGCDWDELLERDKTGALARRMMEVLDGEYQEYAYAAKKGKPELVREKFFNTPELKALVAGQDGRPTRGPAARRARPDQGVQRLPGGPQPPRAAERHPGQDGQGLRHVGRGRATRPTRRRSSRCR